MSKSENMQAPKAPDFTYEALRNSCRELFDVSTSTFDGATALLDKGKRYSIAEIKETIGKWSKGVVK